MARFHMKPWMRNVAYYGGLFVLAIVTFVFAVQATFPYDRVRAKLQDLAAAKVDLKIGDIERGILPGVFYLNDVELKTRAKQDEVDKAYAIADPKERDRAIKELGVTIYIERMKIDVGLLGFIGGKASLDFEAVFGEGTIHGNVTASSGGTELHVVGDSVPSELLPMKEVLSNLPMSGDVGFELTFDLPNEKLKTGKTGPNWQKLEAALDFECPNGCTIGDGKAKLKLKAKNARSQAFAGEGTEFGRVNIQSLMARIEAKDGKVEMTKWDVKSTDVELHVDYGMQLQQVLDESQVTGCVRFKGSDALKKREQKTYDQILLTGAKRHTDGLDHIKLQGTFKDMLKRPEACGPGVISSAGDRNHDGKPDRPNLQITEEPVRPPPPTPTPQPINPPPAPVDAGTVHLDAGAPINIPGGAAGSGSAGIGSGSGSAEGHGSGSGSGEVQDSGLR